MKKAAFAIFIVFLCACEKPNPTPEVLDPIYSELVKQAEELKKGAVEAKNALDGFRKELSEIKPQTGQIEYAKKRVRESEERLTKIEQMAQYYEIRAESRKHFDREEYLKAWNSKTPWPNPKEYESYRESNKAQNSKLNWSVKDRISETGNKPSAKAGEHHSEEKKEAEHKE